MLRVPENPRVVECAAADADGGAAGLVEHAFGGARRGNVAVAGHGDSDRFHNGADADEVDAATETLLAGATVYGDRRRAGVFERTGEFRRGEVVVVPTEPHLAGDRDMNRGYHGRDDLGGASEIGHQRGAAAVATDF